MQTLLSTPYQTLAYRPSNLGIAFWQASELLFNTIYGTAIVFSGEESFEGDGVEEVGAECGVVNAFGWLALSWLGEGRCGAGVGWLGGWRDG